MPRRRRIVLSSAVLLLGIALLVMLGGAVVIQTEYGQERVRRFLSAWLSSKVNGTMYVGRVRGGFFNGVTVDSIEIRDDRGELFLASGMTTLHYDLRDLFDQRLLLRHAQLTNPVVHVRQYADGSWNFRRIFPHGQPQPLGRRRGFGEFIVLDSAAISGGRVQLSLPWHPPANASRTESARLLDAALADPGGHVRTTAHGPVRVWRWDDIEARLGRTRLAHPDTTGRLINVLALAVDSRDPPFRFSEAHGVLHYAGDSIWFDAPHWRLPGSAGRASGKVMWGGDRPTRYSIRIDSEQASLADVAWIYPTFPREGGGRVTAEIRNAAHDQSSVEIALTSLDVSTHGSRVTGRMVVVPDEPVLVIRDMAVRLAPLDFELLRVINGEPFPHDWRGAFSGTVEASGGRVDRFRVERADLVYADARVPGAVSSGVASGVLDISEPARTTFHALALDLARLDLRTPRAVIPEFPDLAGYLSGTVTLDSLWFDVRFRDADVTHHDGDGAVSHFAGSGRVTLEDPYLTYDATLTARQLSFTTLAQSYPGLPLRGEFTGAVQITGQAPNLRVTADLEGRGGALSFDGFVAAEAPVYSARGSGTFARANLSELLHGGGPATALNGRYEVDVTAADAAGAAGTFALSLEESAVAGVRVLSSSAHGRLGTGVLQLDTAMLVTAAGAAHGAGGIAFTKDTTATFRFAAAFDSLSALTPLLAVFAGDSVPAIAGSLSAAGALRTGAIVGLTGDLDARGVALGGRRAERVHGSVDLVREGGRFGGTLSVAADTLRVGGVRFARAHLGARVPAQLDVEGAFEASLLGEGGGMTATGGRIVRGREASVIRLDSLVTRIDADHAYRATAPATIRLADGGVALDSLVLAPTRGAGSLAVRDLLWTADSIAGSIQSRDADLGLLSGVFARLGQASGPLTIELDLAGTRAHPRARGSLQLRDGAISSPGGRFERVTADIALDHTELHIREVSAETPRGGGRRGRARVAGTVDLSDAGNPVFALEATARNFRAISRRGLATLDLSTGPALHLTGPYSGAALSGSLIVDEGTVYLPDRLDKDIADLDDSELQDLADVAEERRTLFPSAPSEFVSNLQLDEVRVVIGEDVWLRSAEANVELGGSLLVTRTPASDNGGAQLALVGSLNATRGTYVLNLAVVQPTFQVERGTLRFFGTPDVNPTLDIRAIHTVRQPRRTLARDDVRVLVSITGTLRDPVLALGSADGLPLSQSDLLSYLVTGEPAFALTGSSTEYAEQILTLGGRLAGTLISARIPRSVFDIVEVRTGAVRLETGVNGGSSYLSPLYDTRVILGKQLSDRWYLGLSTGLCRASFAENLGLRLEYRLSSMYFAQGGIEPGSGDLSCVGPTTARAFQYTPPQLGADLFRSWRF